MENNDATARKKKITSFSDLHAWQEGHKLVLEIYDVTRTFPKEELFTLVSQMRRAALSVTSNIAEGFGRATDKDKIRFYNIALGSLIELQNQLLVARDVDMIAKEKFHVIANQSILVQKLTHGLIRSIKNTSKKSS